MTPTVFARVEEKYLLDKSKLEALFKDSGGSFVEDKWGESYIRNLYLDTPDCLLIRRSIEKPYYKEKLRVRTYGNDCLGDSCLGNDCLGDICGDHCGDMSRGKPAGICPESSESGKESAFVELKKKMDGQVYKRRVSMSLNEARQFVERQVKGSDGYYDFTPAVAMSSGDYLLQRQIRREIAYTIEHYADLQPFMNIHYTRTPYKYMAAGATAEVRVTIDRNVAWAPGTWDGFLWSADDPRLTPLLPDDVYIMEVKAQNGLPLELVHAFSEIGIYPTSFSKVGRAYLAASELNREKENVCETAQLPLRKAAASYGTSNLLARKVVA
jgi:hypothetical protein